MSLLLRIPILYLLKKKARKAVSFCGESKMNRTRTSLGIIGVGAMGSCILGGVVKAKVFPPQDIYIYDIDKDKTSILQKKYKVNVSCDNIELTKKARVMLLSVKPKEMGKLLSDIKEHLLGEKIIISIAAGIPISFIEKTLGEKISVIRAMPNIACQVKEGMCVLSGGSYAKKKDINLVQNIFAPLGEVWTVEEKYLDAVTALAGSGPAYFSVIIEALSDAGVKIGLPRENALFLATQTALGTAKMIKEEKIHPAILKDRVSSPGGTTIAGLSELENGKVRASIIKAVGAAYKRAKEISSLPQ